MKLTAKEKTALTLFRELHARQRDKLLAQMERQVLANQITERVSGTKLDIVDDKKIEKSYGTAPKWKLQGGVRRRPK